MLQKARDATDKIMLTLHDTLKAMDVHNVHKGLKLIELLRAGSSLGINTG